MGSESRRQAEGWQREKAKRSMVVHKLNPEREQSRWECTVRGNT